MFFLSPCCYVVCLFYFCVFLFFCLCVNKRKLVRNKNVCFLCTVLSEETNAPFTATAVSVVTFYFEVQLSLSPQIPINQRKFTPLPEAFWEMWVELEAPKARMKESSYALTSTKHRRPDDFNQSSNPVIPSLASQRPATAEVCGGEERGGGEARSALPRPRQSGVVPSFCHSSNTQTTGQRSPEQERSPNVNLASCP